MTECVESVMVDLSKGFLVVRLGGLQEMTEFLYEWCSFLSGNVGSDSNGYYIRGLHQFPKENGRMC
jgi:hypothetical protein